jgi:hypothetical protein
MILIIIIFKKPDNSDASNFASLGCFTFYTENQVGLFFLFYKHLQK